MRFPCLIIFVLLFPVVALAQNGVITGTVTQEGTVKPLSRASVFLSNSSVGTATSENGTFALRDIRPGQYTLVVTILGYENYTKTVLVGREPIKMNIELAAKPLMLREVVISSAADWKKNYDAFKKEFIGTDENAKYCTVVNPHILNLTYNPTKQILHADADEFLVVENKALGYRVKYLLNDFKIDKISGIISRQGQQVFEELPGTEAQKKKWHLKREEAYYGSAMHFYRSLYKGRLKEEGFEVYHLNRHLNREKPADEVIRRKIQFFREHGMSDSLKRWITLSGLSKYANESLVRPPYQDFEIVSNSGQAGIYAVHFSNYLYVVYTKRNEMIDYRDLFRDLKMPNYEVSVVTMQEHTSFFDIDSNGTVLDDAPLYEGAWSRSRISDLLPVDFAPDVK
ncbi:MAG TPA: carboxypeptidase-like regulatory domain-containing protein [Mucilaginibacter sp.]|jgi:hypothetical protein|nr:carboxypeptidase-like regulatory domain-containing protein [Mucilaginibacter sp.]